MDTCHDGTPLCFGEFYDSIRCERCEFYDSCEATYLDEAEDLWGFAEDLFLAEEEAAE